MDGTGKETKRGADRHDWVGAWTSISAYVKLQQVTVQARMGSARPTTDQRRELQPCYVKQCRTATCHSQNRASRAAGRPLSWRWLILHDVRSLLSL